MGNSQLPIFCTASSMISGFGELAEILIDKAKPSDRSLPSSINHLSDLTGLYPARERWQLLDLSLPKKAVISKFLME